MKCLTEIKRDRFGGRDRKAINRHSIRVYEDDKGNLYQMDRICDSKPRYFTAYGPYKPDHYGILPKLPISDWQTFSRTQSWKEANKMLEKSL